MSSLNPSGPKMSSGSGAERPSLLWSCSLFQKVLRVLEVKSSTLFFNALPPTPPTPIQPHPPSQPRPPIPTNLTLHAHTPPWETGMGEGIMGRVPWSPYPPVERCDSQGPRKRQNTRVGCLCVCEAVYIFYY